MEAIRLPTTVNKFRPPDLPDNVVEGILSTPRPDLEYDSFLASGCTSRTDSVVACLNHDMNAVIGRAYWSYSSALDAIRVRIVFTDANKIGPETCRLVKQGVLTDLSIGAMPLEWEPIKGGKGKRYTKWRLLECSVVTVGCNLDAVITAKALTSKADRVAHAQTLAAPPLPRAERIARVAALAHKNAPGASRYNPEVQARIDYQNAIEAARVASGHLTKPERILHAERLRDRTAGFA